MKRILAGMILFGISLAQPYMVGDAVADFQQSICENGSGDWSLYSSTGYDGGGSATITLLTFFASW